jgi:hypothetical protein
MREGVTGDCRKLHNEQLHDLYSSQNIGREIKAKMFRWVVHVACMGRRAACRVLVRRHEGKRSLGGCRYT